MPSTRVRSGRSRQIFLWVPPTKSPIYKIEVEDKDSGSTTDVTDNLISGEYTDGITETIGNFNLVIDNSSQELTGQFSPYDIVNIYLDYADTATTLKFKGRLERISHQHERIRLVGRNEAVRTLGITVTQEFNSQYTHDILQSLLDTYATFITQGNISTIGSTDTRTTVNWNQKPFWECIQELSSKASYDAYIDATGDFHYFVSGTRQNSTDAAVHEYNLIQTGDFTPDTSIVKNRIIVYGAETEGVPLVWTEEDSDSIDNFEAKELIINDTNIKTVEQAKDRALYELSLNKDPPIVGEVSSLLLPTISPGEKVQISDPLNNLDPQYYTIQKFTHRFSNDEPPMTTLTVQKETSTIPKILKKRIQVESETSSKPNPNEMRFSVLYDFESDSGTHSSTEISDGLLKTDGGASGTWISPTTEITDNVSSFEVRASGNSLPGTVYYVSLDGGSTYQTIDALNTEQTSSPPGNSIRFKVDLNSASTEVKVASIMYKT